MFFNRKLREELDYVKSKVRELEQECLYNAEDLQKFKGYVYGKRGKVRRIKEEDPEEEVDLSQLTADQQELIMLLRQQGHLPKDFKDKDPE